MKPGYLELIELFVNLTTKTGNKPNIKRLGREMTLVGMKISLSAPDAVVKKYVHWRGMAMTGDVEEVVKAFADLLLEIRKDCLRVSPNVHPDTKCTIDDMLDMFIATE